MKKLPEFFCAKLFLIIMAAGLFFAEFLIYYNPEARVDLYRMMPAPIFSMLMFEIALAGLVAGIASTKRIFVSFVEVIDGYSAEGLIMGCIFAGAGITCGGVTIFRWVKHIIIDNYPAFGEGAKNVYSLVGLNTLIYLFLAGVVGVVLGLIIGGFLYLFARIIKFFGPPFQ